MQQNANQNNQQQTNLPMTFVCKKCNTVFSGQFFCPKCGKKVKVDRCKKCGGMLDADKDFCPHCGKKKKKSKVAVVFLILGIILAVPAICLQNSFLLVLSLAAEGVSAAVTLRVFKNRKTHKTRLCVSILCVALTLVGYTTVHFVQPNEAELLNTHNEPELVDTYEQIYIQDDVTGFQEYILGNEKLDTGDIWNSIFENDCTKIFEYLLSIGASVPLQIDGENLFEYGYKHGYRIPMEYAIQTQNIDVNQKRNGKPILLDAVERRNSTAISVLIKAGADTNIRTVAGLSLLEEACYQGWDESIVALLENGVSPIPSNNNNSNLIQLYIEQNLSIATSGENGHESDKAIAKLLEYGCPVAEVPNGSTMIPLAELALHDNAYITLQQLVKMGVDMNDIELIKYNMNPFNGNEEEKLKTIEVFLTSNYDVRNRDSDGNTIFTLFADQVVGSAASSDSEEFYRRIVEMLLNKGSNIEEKNNDGETALFIASTSVHYRRSSNGALLDEYVCSPENVKKYITVLLEFGANINAKNNAGETAVATGLVPTMTVFMENNGCRA